MSSGLSPGPSGKAGSLVTIHKALVSVKRISDNFAGSEGTVS